LAFFTVFQSCVDGTIISLDLAYASIVCGLAAVYLTSDDFKYRKNIGEIVRKKIKNNARYDGLLYFHYLFPLIWVLVAL
jgi:hypothetical protein